MADTRQEILDIGESLIRQRGYHAFSYQDISVPLGIKNAAIHYYFPRKADLAIHIIRNARHRIDEAKVQYAGASSTAKLKAVIEAYAKSHKEQKVCLMGALAAEFYSLEEGVQEELKKVALEVQKVVADVLIEGKKRGEFYFTEKPKTKAMLVITNLLAALQLERITGNNEFSAIQNSIIKNLTTTT